MKQINIFHIAIVAPLMIYIGYQGYFNHNLVNKNFYLFTLMLGLLALASHLYRLNQ